MTISSTKSVNDLVQLLLCQQVALDDVKEKDIDLLLSSFSTYPDHAYGYDPLKVIAGTESLEEVPCEREEVNSEDTKIASKKEEVTFEDATVNSEHESMTVEHKGVTSEHQTAISEQKEVTLEHEPAFSECKSSQYEAVTFEDEPVASQNETMVIEKEKVTSEHQKATSEQKVTVEHEPAVSKCVTSQYEALASKDVAVTGKHETAVLEDEAPSSEHKELSPVRQSFSSPNSSQLSSSSTEIPVLSRQVSSSPRSYTSMETAIQDDSMMGNIENEPPFTQTDEVSLSTTNASSTSEMDEESWSKEPSDSSYQDSLNLDRSLQPSLSSSFVSTRSSSIMYDSVDLADLQELKPQAVIGRICELRKQGKWSLTRLPLCLEAPRRKVHYDYLLEHVQMMGLDFQQERQLKPKVAKIIAEEAADLVRRKKYQENMLLFEPGAKRYRYI
ncbi:unnamed protein product [Bursaphelenchus okinawaensis]|uniref:HSA domain-containing protein n=1 Tax=Bursaphelenchus okinawaensis TaxID=465554 RepID=A0A811KGV4_9BILA|nr:unnamed protein product [Bursaphelenchus okinawaensis]CAG9102937.1 unnamed protein product [Bursaphelenchus okinawaensis]